MLVSWNWLRRYVDLDMAVEQLTDRLSMSGLNHEETRRVDGETVIDLEVTSNRGDCLGHIGVAREISVLYDRPLCLPDPRPPATGPSVETLVSVTPGYLEACPRYTARVIRGVQVGPSPEWLVSALRSIGLSSVNNVVDVTNWVMFECGQPLHAFDLGRLAGPEIRIRRAREGEQIEAIDHRLYQLTAEDCVIADAEHAVAVAGVMGGAASEVTASTRDLLIEAAIFTPLAVRRTARRLKLHSPSSYRFERRVDPEGVEWASRRCCELNLQVAGGELAEGILDTAPAELHPPEVTLRLAQIPRVLGIEIELDEVRRILTALGCREVSSDAERITVVPPSWRSDLPREADLIEEVARIHGYEEIPDDSPIPVMPSSRRPFDTVMDRVRSVLTAGGISEAMTPSVVSEALDRSLSPWTDQPALATQAPMLEGARSLRRSLLPSLLQSRAVNQAASGLQANLFEVAHIYLPQAGQEALPTEQYTLGFVTGLDFYDVKGLLEALLGRLNVPRRMTLESASLDLVDPYLCGRLMLGETTLGYVGRLSDAGRARFKLDAAVTVCELSLVQLVSWSNPVPQFTPVSPFPVVRRDLNLVVDEKVRWADLETAIFRAVGVELVGLRYLETYRNPEKDGPDKKRLLMSLELQRPDATLTGVEADQMVNAAIGQCERDFKARLLQ